MEWAHIIWEHIIDWRRFYVLVNAVTAHSDSEENMWYWFWFWRECVMLILILILSLKRRWDTDSDSDSDSEENVGCLLKNSHHFHCYAPVYSLLCNNGLLAQWYAGIGLTTLALMKEQFCTNLNDKVKKSLAIFPSENIYWIWLNTW